MKLTTGAVVTVDVEEWGQQLQAFHIPSSQETHSNMLVHMNIQAQF